MVVKAHVLASRGLFPAMPVANAGLTKYKKKKKKKFIE